jgi:DNA-binding transcriptional ArsR family regulator
MPITRTDWPALWHGISPHDRSFPAAEDIKTLDRHESVVTSLGKGAIDSGNQMVAYRAMVADEDSVFKALADASRRQLLDRLRKKNGLTLGDLCEGHDMSRQAVTKHLALLAAANLVVTQWRGREKLHYLNPVPIHEIYMRWIGRFEKGRLQALHNLKQALQEDDHG